MARFFPPERVQHYPVAERLFAGEYPGELSRDTALARLRELTDKDVTTFIDLTTPEDAARGLEPYDHLLAEIQQPGAPELRHYRFAIPDMEVPASAEVMHGVLDLIQAEKEAGRTCYVHCWGGIGRTGTAVACWLVESGMTPDDALAKVQELYSGHMGAAKLARYPHSPQQPAQLEYVRAWPSLLTRQTTTGSQTQR